MKLSSRLTLVAVLACAAAVAAQAQQAPQKPPAAGTKSNPRAAAPAPAAPAAAAPARGESNPEFEKAGQNAAHAWLMLLDRKDWGSAWDASSGVFRKNVPLATWMDNVPKLREPLGAFTERQPAELAYRKTLAGQSGDYVTAIFVSKFEKKADVMETVTTVREPDGRWRVTGYTAR